MNDKDLLKQHNNIKREIKELEKRIEKLSNMKIEHDKVTGSNNEFPYQAMSFNIEGYNIHDVDRLNKLKRLLADRRCKCEDVKFEIEEFISTIPDSLTRMVFQYRYIDNLSWQAIAMRIGKIHESYPRKIHDRYLES